MLTLRVPLPAQATFTFTFTMYSATDNVLIRVVRGMHPVARVIKPQDKTLVRNNFVYLVFSLIT
jgi:hypothetical protein